MILLCNTIPFSRKMFLTIKISSVNKVYNDTKNGLKSINMFFINNSDSQSLKIIRFFFNILTIVSKLFEQKSGV